MIDKTATDMPRSVSTVANQIVNSGIDGEGVGCSVGEAVGVAVAVGVGVIVVVGLGVGVRVGVEVGAGLVVVVGFGVSVGLGVGVGVGGRETVTCAALDIGEVAPEMSVAEAAIK